MQFLEYALMVTLWFQIKVSEVGRLQKTGPWKCYVDIFGIFIFSTLLIYLIIDRGIIDYLMK